MRPLGPVVDAGDVDKARPSSGDPVPATHDREMRLIRDAIRLVAAGGSPRVVVAGLRLADSLLPAAQGLAAEAGVRVVPLWGSEDHLTDVAVEPAADGAARDAAQ